MRLLVFNCHEAWVHQLAGFGCDLDIVVGLKGRLVAGWDRRMRPVPAGARLVTLDEACEQATAPDCIIAHNLTDLLDAKSIAGPRLLVLHTTLDSRLADAGATVPPAEMRAETRRYLRLVGGHAVAISPLKAKSWGGGFDILPNGVDVGAYPPPAGDLARGLRVANQIGVRRRYFLWDFHEAAFAGLPVDIVGHNPDMPGVEAAADWDALKETLRRRRFFVHTADPALEDGVNMAMMEAMAAGLPVIGNAHPTSPIRHGVDGFLAETPDAARAHAERLLADAELARRMGAAARETAARRFSPVRFRQGMRRAIAAARRKWRRRPEAGSARPARPGRHKAGLAVS